MSADRERIETIVIDPIINIGWRFYIFAALMMAVVLWGAYAYWYQLQNGLGVTGLNQRVFWGIYMANFVFFIGISHAGTLISAILRVTHTEWRKPLTRMAEAITLIALFIGAAQVVVDMGRPDRLILVIFQGRLISPIFWDFLSISTYITGSLLFLYVAMIPDIALLRDKFNEMDRFSIRKYLYRVLAIGWQDSPAQRERLNKSLAVIAILIIPIAISVHTVVSWVFAMTWRVGWNSTIFGPYFVVGAIFSGIAALIVAMAVYRKVYHLEEIIDQRLFRNLGYLLFVFVGIYFYFTFAEYLTSVYRGGKGDVELIEELFLGEYIAFFFVFIVAALFLPGIILVFSCWKYESEKAVWATASAAALVVLGMWVKRYIIVVPALSRPFVLQAWTRYVPTWVEVSITLASVAAFLLAYAIFSRIFPIVSIWELFEDEAAELAEAKKVLSKDKPA
ncbi:MAG: NrfD/PsrC family molybdoenzyme membrane anchor subunit [Candidatus Heimdallarchaeota archaeon]